MKVALFGGTGFVGSYLVDALLGHGHEPALLVRPGSEYRIVHGAAVRIVRGSIDDERAMAMLLEGSDAAIYNIGLLREYPARGIRFRELHFEAARRTMDLAAQAGVQRYLLMSANGVSAQGTAYQSTKYLAEEYLKTTGLDWTILRPSVIFGNPRGRMEFATRLYREVVRSPLPVPLFFPGLRPAGAGAFRLSPVHVEDVAQVFACCLDDPATVGRILPLGGPEALTWKEILRRIAVATGQPFVAVPVPAWGVRPVAAMLERFAFFPLTRDQLAMLMAGNVCDSQALLVACRIQPRRFDRETLRYLTLPGTNADAVH